MKTKILLIALLVIHCTILSQTKYSNTEIDEMISTYSFYIGQLNTVDEIMTNHPEYKMKAKTAQDLWNRNFKSSVNNIISELELYIGDNFESFKSELQTKLNNVDYSDVTNDDIEYTINLINNRANGDMPSPFLETLLSFNPRYQANPEKEMIDGFFLEFFTNESAKSKGLDIKLKYPRSWKAENGDRPHVIQKFTSDNGHGLETALIMIMELKEGYSQSEINYLLTEEEVKKQLPENSKVIDIETDIFVGNVKATSITSYQIQQQMEFELGIFSKTYLLYYDNYQVVLMFSSGSISDQYDDIYNRYQANEKLFWRIANNLVILSKY